MRRARAERHLFPAHRPDDAELARLLGRAAAGDSDAFARFYDLTCQLVYKYARVLSPDPATADALAREVYLQAWHGAASQPASGMSPFAWLLARRGRAEEE